MKTILIADDDRDLLEPICAYLSQREASLETVPATSGSECIEILKSRQIDLVLSDLRMPDGDGIDVLAYISRHYPSLPVVVMSGYVQGGNSNELVKFGSLRFLGKPAGLDQVFRTIDEALRQPQELGSFNGFTLAGVLQLIEMEEKTCLLELARGTAGRGCFAFVDGRMVRAACDQLQGEDAALEMLTWEQPGIRVHQLPHSDKLEPDVDCSVTELLMRSFQDRDEMRGDQQNADAAAGEGAGTDAVGDLFNLAASTPSVVEEPRPIPAEAAPEVLPAAPAEHPAQAESTGLHFKRSKGPEPQSTARDPVETALPTSVAYSRKVKVERLSPIPGVMVFLFIVGLMVGYQWQAAQFAEFMPYYTWARNTMVLVVAWLVVADAYQSGPLYAALCVVLPPYTLVYAATRLTSYILRGLFLAALAVLAAEVYFIPDHSLALALQNGLAQLIEHIDGLIVRAGE